jgi:hypothetical protein
MKKTLLALAVAMAGFGTTLAWSAEPAPRDPAVRAAPKAAPAPAKPATKPTPQQARGTRTPVVPAFDERLLDGPAVLCACTRSRVQA